jgi:hypothetical protein
MTIYVHTVLVVFAALRAQALRPPPHCSFAVPVTYSINICGKKPRKKCKFEKNLRKCFSFSHSATGVLQGLQGCRSGDAGLPDVCRAAAVVPWVLQKRVLQERVVHRDAKVLQGYNGCMLQGSHRCREGVPQVPQGYKRGATGLSRGDVGVPRLSLGCCLQECRP